MHERGNASELSCCDDRARHDVRVQPRCVVLDISTRVCVNVHTHQIMSRSPEVSRRLEWFLRL